jgi:hypothetical protein
MDYIAQHGESPCTDNHPVCAQVDTGIRCITTPCPSTEWKTFGNSCTACATEGVLGWKDGACGEVCQSKYKAKCDGGSVYWFDSCGNKEGKKEYCPLGCSEGACIKDKNVCEIEKNYLEKPSCNCPDGYEMIVVYPKCATAAETATAETPVAAEASATSGGGGGSASTTGAITGMPIAQAVKTVENAVSISEAYTTVSEEKCAGGAPFYRCVKKTQCQSHAKAACSGSHLYWFDSCGNVQEKKQYCENGCEAGACIPLVVCPQWAAPAPDWCEGGTVVSGGEDDNGCQQPPRCVKDEDVCCESFGYGSEMVECCQTYEWTTAAECAVAEGFVGGGKQVVDDSHCEAVSTENCTKVPFGDADGDGCNAGVDSDCGGIEGVDNPGVTCYNGIDDDCDGMIDANDTDLSCSLTCGDGVCGWYERIETSGYYCSADCAALSCTDFYNAAYVPGYLNQHDISVSSRPCEAGSLIAKSSSSCGSYSDCGVYLYVYEFANESCALSTYSSMASALDADTNTDKTNINGEEVYVRSADGVVTYSFQEERFIIILGGTNPANCESYVTWIISRYA